MKSFIRQGIATLSVLSASIAFAHAAPELEQLQQQVAQLEQSLQQLKQQLRQVHTSENSASQHLDESDELAEDASLDDQNELVTKADLNGIQADIENFKYQVQRDRETKTALSTRQVLINGVVQAKASYIDKAQNSAPVGKATGTAVQDRHSSFDLGAVQIGFVGNLFRDYENGKNLDFNLRFGTSPQTGTNNSFLNLLDAQLTYQLLPTISNDTGRFSLTLGQQLLPFGQEVQATEDLKPTINNALFSLPVYGYGLALREVGLIARGDAFPTVDFGYNYRSPMITYAFGVVNGNGANKSDDNDDKNFVGRLRYTMPADYNSWLRELSFGASWYQGKRNLFDDSGAQAFYAGKGDIVRRGLDVYYNHHPFGVTYEYVQAEDDTYNLAAKVIYNRKSESHTGTLFWNFGEQFVKGFRNQGRYDDWWPKSYQTFYRYDSLDYDKDKSNKDIQIHSVGLNAFFAETTKFQLNFNHVDNAITDQNYNELVAQFQYGF